MAWYRCGGGGVPASVKTDMNAVLNKKFGTSTDYPPADWAPTVNLMGPLPEKTQASAPVCAFDDGADDVPTKSVVTIPPTLSGVSSVSVTQTGRNLVDFNSHLESSYSDLAISGGADGSISFSGTPNRSWAHLTTDFDIDLPVGSYTLGRSGSSASYAVYIAVRYEDGTTENISMALTNLKSFTTTKKINRIRLDIASLSTSTNYNETFFVMLEYGSTAHAFEPYQTPTTYTASLGRTIYGGTADIVNGQGTENISAPTALNSLTWSKTTVSGHDAFYANLPDGYIGQGGGGLDGDCDTYAITTDANLGTDKTIRFYYNANFNISRCVIRDDQYASYTGAQFKEAVTGNIVYLLAESARTDFTFTGQEIPTRLGYNAFWSDEGDTEVTYRADIDLLLGGN